VLEFVGIHPMVLFDHHAPEKSHMGRWATEARDAKAKPQQGNSGE
jgi:hypothetical protein